MYVLSVIPLSRTAPPLPLSYRSTTELLPGSLVSVPLRKRIVRGLVVECVPVREAKYALKSATFTLAKSTTLQLGRLSPALLAAAEEVALYHACSMGAVLAALIVPVLPEQQLVASEEAPALRTSAATHTLERCEDTLLARRARYAELCTEGTTLLVVPTQAEAEEWAGWCAPLKPLVLTGKLTRERREAALTRASTHTGLIIATPGFSWVPIPHLTRLIIERVSAGTYNQPKRPYLDLRYALSALARAQGIPLVYGDYPLPLEYRADPTQPLPPLAAGKVEIIDTRIPRKSPEKNSVTVVETRTPWQAVPERLRTDIRTTIQEGGRVAVLAVRRGYAPTVVCGDCGTTLTDPHGRTLSLVTHKGVRVFRSTDGSVTESAESFCKVCGSWNLKSLGIGIELVEEELRAAFPKVPLISITEESRKAATLKKVREEIQKPGTIILGTESMLPWLSVLTPVDLGVVASADSLLALPFWRSRERFVRIGRLFAERATHLLIATRRPDDTVFTDSFWEEETNLRKILAYPPFGSLIVFHLEGSPTRIATDTAAVTLACAPFIPRVVSERALSATTQRATLVLLLPMNTWPITDLSERIARLSPSIRVLVDAESLW
jgi:primosomal protein N'